MNIDFAIRKFSEFLNNSWVIVTPLLLNRVYTTDESSKSDWLQMNWEILVERKVLQINEYLEVYGEGADFNGASSRITDIDAMPTFYVKVLVERAEDILNNTIVTSEEFAFEQLVGFKDGFYIDSAPFDFVLVRDMNIGVERVFSLKSVSFKLQSF